MFRWRKRIEDKLDQLLRKGVLEMSALTDLVAAEAAIAAGITALGTSVQNAITLIGNLQNGTVNADDPQVEAVVTKLQADQAALATASASLTGATAPVAAAATAISTVPSAPSTADKGRAEIAGGPKGGTGAGPSQQANQAK
jgi:hypothetical protein